jgi:hypothetical protein
MAFPRIHRPAGAIDEAGRRIFVCGGEAETGPRSDLVVLPLGP